MLKKNIPFLLSGGSTNTKPNKSLGGPMSTQRIDMKINNLFSDVTRAHSFSGYTDYRCLYVMNDNLDDKLKDLSFYISKSNSVGSEITLGLSLQSDVQALIVAGSPPNGYFQLQYTLKHAHQTYIQTTRRINWMPDANLMAQRIAAVLNSLDFLHGVLCTGQSSSSGFDFLITFGGESSGRKQELLGAVNQVGIQVTTMSVTKGGPINSVAPNIGLVNNPPSGVTFFDSDKITPILVGTLLPTDFVPVWFQRVVAPNTKPVHPDFFRLHLFGHVLPILVGTKTPTTMDTMMMT
jgi:hypothetical protein